MGETLARTFAEEAINAGVAHLGAGYRLGRFDPVDTTEIYLDRIARFDGRTGCYVALDAEGALAAARASRARFAHAEPLSALDGVPIAIKANILVSGLPCHAGIGAYRHRLAEEDASCVSRLRRAGVIILGMVNLHEACAGATTNNEAFGPTHNPWRHGFTPAGSSGGSAAAVTAGLAAAALGTDTAGSVRLPAAFTGSYGFKPSLEAISIQGAVPLASALDHVGIHARSVEDCRLLWHGLTRHRVYPPSGPLDRKPRLATLDLERWQPLNEDIVRAFQRSVARAKSAGMTVDTIDIHPIDLPVVMSLVGSELSALYGADLRGASDGFSIELREMVEASSAFSASDVVAGHQSRRRISDGIRDALENYDALLTPSAGIRPHAFEEASDPRIAMFTLLGNFSGLPAMAFPAGLGGDGMPASNQLLAWDEETALTLADMLAEEVGAPPHYG